MDKNKNRVLKLLLVGAILLPSIGSADTLHQALISAYSNNPTLNAARAGQRAQHETVSQALAGRRPNIDATTTLGLQTQRNFQSGGFGSGGFNDDFKTGSASVTITQNLFNGFQITNNIKSAESGVRAGRESLRNIEQTVLQQTVTAYSDVLRDREILRLQTRNVAFSREQLRAARAQAEVGEGTRTDVALAEANLADSLSELAASKSALKSSEATYLQVIGHVARKLSPASDAAKHLPKTLNSALSIGLKQHPLIRAAQHNVDAGQFNVKVSEGTLLPSVSLNGSLQRNFQVGTADSNADAGSVTANVTIPIFQGGARFSNIRQAKELVSQLRIQVDEVRRNIDQLIRASWAALVASRSQISSAQTNVRASQVALDGLVEERKVGEATTLDVLNAQSNLITAQVGLANARRDRIVASYAVLSSIGHFTGDRIGVAQVTNVESTKYHYKKVRDKWNGFRTVSGN